MAFNPPSLVADKGSFRTTFPVTNTKAEQGRETKAGDNPYPSSVATRNLIFTLQVSVCIGPARTLTHQQREPENNLSLKVTLEGV